MASYCFFKRGAMAERFIGLDVGAETVKAAELVREGGDLRWARRRLVEHHKEPGPALLDLLKEWDWSGAAGAAVTGRLGRRVDLRRVPTRAAQAAGYRLLHGDGPATLVSIGSHGFSVLELRPNGVDVFRENARCSQGTGNFLRQLVERLGLTLEEACRLAEGVEDAVPLSGRCPVILKTDMTHLANKGEDRGRILAGLFDAVCENVQVLIKPRLSPSPVVLFGGVARARRVRDHFRRFCARHGLTAAAPDAEAILFLEAVGCARVAAGLPGALPALDRLVMGRPEGTIEFLPPLAEHRARVHRRVRPAGPAAKAVSGTALILGLDIGSTGSKAVALDAATCAPIWEAYAQTNGHPVGAAQGLVRRFVEGAAGRQPVLGVGVTGSGREIVRSILATCYGPEAVYVLNEIAAHAEGALSVDPRVDTIFEIGGQDAKYIRLEGGRVVDAAMNEACSAGTGSFIEEQGRKFAGIRDVVHLGEEALRADAVVSLGQHCSVFMAEIIDEAVAAGADQRAIIAGIYDAVIQNYLNRVKGNRSVGQVIFCQGMPFASDALAAAVARQTGREVVVPPSPGMVGALGIARLAARELASGGRDPLDLRRFLDARLESKETFVCRSIRGCGGAGNRCRIDAITTRVAGVSQRFAWGGGCALYDRGTRRRKLPDRAPDPFREREELVRDLLAGLDRPREGRRVALTDEFVLKELFPFFATFLARLGFDLDVRTGADHALLRRGIEMSNVPFCAPMQQFHGLVAAMVEGNPDLLFLPMLRGTPRAGAEPHAAVCPITQSSPDILRWDLGVNGRPTIVSTVIDVGPGNLESEAFQDSCRRLAADLGCPDDGRWREAHRAGAEAQARFEARCREMGRRTLDFCAERGVVPVVVLGRAYTIYNTVLNSNVPALLREQGAVAIPVDCYPVDPAVPVFPSVYWGYGQRNLRAAHQIRRTPGVYSLYCSNYSCGPDSFLLHFYAYAMEGKPFAVIETDGHSGDAGTKTRVEAFLHCVHEDRRAGAAGREPRTFARVEGDGKGLAEIRARGERVLIPRMGPAAECVAACLRSFGIPAESLPMPDRESVRIGRRYTSGKECLPLCITLGSLAQRLERERDTTERFAFLMPTTNGPCRFGVYNLLHRIALERLGWADRVRLWSPTDASYFDGLPGGFSTLLFSGFQATDFLLEALYDARPAEVQPGMALAIYERCYRELIDLLERRGRGILSLPAALWQVTTGRLFGIADLLRRAAAEFAAIREPRPMPTVLVTGEIYVRCDPFANDFVVEKLERRGIRCRFAPASEWIEYTDLVSPAVREGRLGARFAMRVRCRIQDLMHGCLAGTLGWPPRTTVPDALRAAAPYVREALEGEAVLTVGSPLHEWREGAIDGVVSVGPLECMPNKIAEAQLFHVAEEEGLLSISLPLNGDPVDPEVLDHFAFEVHARFRGRDGTGSPGAGREAARRLRRHASAPRTVTP
jgi:predicted CoA-substrate-specific enzyme activase